MADTTKLEKLDAALKDMEGYPLNFRAHGLLRELAVLVATQVKEERDEKEAK